MIKDLVILEPEIFDKGERRTFIKKAADVYKVHPNSIVKYLKKYWKRGMTKNSLLPDFYNCGGIGKEKKAGEMKRGRKRISKILDVGINIDEEVKKIFRVAINRYYYNSSKKPLTLTYEHMIKDFFVRIIG